jgi:D-beta-D-heptose 7-phosphate kinase/D-beta-D-heptose 1-phosphate adenosyltransferase
MKGFTNGCYDILHVGHLKLLQYLKSRCEYVVVGIDSDKRVKELKGSERPINNEKDRKYMLESLTFVDKVVIFNCENDLIKLVLEESPDLMVVGSDYKNRHVVGSQHAGNLEFFEKLDGYSTTRILQHRSDW